MTLEGSPKKDLATEVKEALIGWEKDRDGPKLEEVIKRSMLSHSFSEGQAGYVSENAIRGRKWAGDGISGISSLLETLGAIVGEYPKDNPGPVQGAKNPQE